MATVELREECLIKRRLDSPPTNFEKCGGTAQFTSTDLSNFSIPLAKQRKMNTSPYEEEIYAPSNYFNPNSISAERRNYSYSSTKICPVDLLTISFATMNLTGECLFKRRFDSPPTNFEQFKAISQFTGANWSISSKPLTMQKNLAMVAEEMEIYVLSNGFNPMRAERFDCTSNQWTPLNIRGGISQRSWFSMSSFGGSRQRVLYLLGGAYLGPGLQRNTGQFDVYEIDAKRWRELRPLPTPRRSLTTFCFDDGHQIYACGGWLSRNAGAKIHDGFALSIVEQYSMERNRWEALGHMNKERSSSMGITFSENIAYVIGGFDGRIRLQTGERFDRREGIWWDIASMREARSVAGAELINGSIYAVGGCNGEVLNTVEIYEPRMNEWSTGPSMNLARTCHSVVFDGRRYLYAIGGRSGGSSIGKMPFSSIEVLDMLSVGRSGDGQWNLGPSMKSISGSVKAIAVQSSVS